MLAFFEQVVAPEERARVCKIELLDELEEWRMLLNHYCVTLAVTDEGDTPMFADVALRKPLKRPPLDAILSSPASPPTATRTSSAGPPLNNTFDEADEALYATAKARFWREVGAFNASVEHCMQATVASQAAQLHRTESAAL